MRGSPVTGAENTREGKVLSNEVTRADMVKFEEGTGGGARRGDEAHLALMIWTKTDHAVVENKRGKMTVSLSS